jgi:hypothetical protein
MGAGWGQPLERNKVDNYIRDLMDVSPPPPPPDKWSTMRIRGRIDIEGVPSDVSGTLEYKEN